MSFMLGKDKVGDFKGKVGAGDKFKSGYKKDASYDPSFSGAEGAKDLQGLEGQLGITAFDQDDYIAQLEGGARARADEGIRRSTAQVGDTSRGRGMARSGAGRALAQEAVGTGERGYSMEMSKAAQDAAGKKLQEDGRRSSAAQGAAGSLADDRFRSAQFKEDQSQFGAGEAFAEHTTNEDMRRYDQEAEYGLAVDKYAEEKRKQQRRDDERAARWDLGTSVVGAAGQVGGAALMCKIAEASFGDNHPLTNQARYIVNVEWSATEFGRVLQSLYAKNMDWISNAIHKFPKLKLITKPLFSFITRNATTEMSKDGVVKETK